MINSKKNMFLLASISSFLFVFLFSILYLFFNLYDLGLLGNGQIFFSTLKYVNILLPFLPILIVFGFFLLKGMYKSDMYGTLLKRTSAVYMVYLFMLGAIIYPFISAAANYSYYLGGIEALLFIAISYLFFQQSAKFKKLKPAGRKAGIFVFTGSVLIFLLNIPIFLSDSGILSLNQIYQTIFILNILATIILIIGLVLLGIFFYKAKDLSEI